MDPNLIWLNLNEDPPRKPFVLVYVFVLGASSIAGGFVIKGKGLYTITNGHVDLVLTGGSVASRSIPNTLRLSALQQAS